MTYCFGTLEVRFQIHIHHSNLLAVFNSNWVLGVEFRGDT